LIGNIGSPSVANQTLAACSPIFSWAIREEIGQVKVNPCAKIEMNEKTDRERILSDSEITKFWAAFEDEGLLASVALKTVLLTGQRPGEVRHMRREHIKDGWWDLPGKPIKELGWPGTKNGESNRIWLPTAVQDLIAEIGEAETGFVFANDTGKPIRALDEAMRNVCTRLEIGDKVTPHDLRRTFGTTVTRLGFGRQAMDRILNHTDSGVGSVYDRHGYAAEDKKIMEAVTAKFMAMINGEQEADNVVRIAS
jgi:integrase